MAIQYETLKIELFGLVPYKGYDTFRLRCVALALALALPPAFVWLRRHQWQFTIRSLLIGFALAAVTLGWLQKDFAGTWLSGTDYSKWLAPSWEMVLIGFVLSAIFTFAITSKKTYAACNMIETPPDPADTDPAANPHGGVTTAEPQADYDAKIGITRVRVQKAKIILLGTVAAIAYGIVHDQITARLCVEYFTIGHPPLFHTTSPTILGICWGIAATFGVGALLGVVLALVSQSEGPPPVPILRVLKSILGLLAIMAISASLAGVVGFELSQGSIICIPETLAGLVPSSQHHRFMAVWLAHGASYLVGIAGSAFIILRIWWARGRPRVLSILPNTTGGIIRAMILAAIAALIVWFRFARS